MVYFIIPAYNEERNLPLLIKNTKEAMASLGRPYTITIVNDGSTDGTSRICAELAKEAPLVEVVQERNSGVDAAFRRGFDEVLRVASPSDVIVTKEADNTSDPAILVHLIEAVESGSDVALASCYAKDGRVENSTVNRRFLSFCANMLLKLSFPIKGVNTYSSFYRAYNARSIRNAFEAYEGRLLEEKGFVCMVEMVVKLSRLPLKITEVPMVLWCDRREGASKMRRRRTIAGYLRFIASQAVRSRARDREVLERYRRLAGLS